MPMIDKNSIRNKCKVAGVEYNYVLYRVNKKGMTVEEAIEDLKQKQSSKPAYALCEEAGLTYPQVYYWMRKGLSLEEAIEKLKRKRKTGESIRRRCAEAGVSYKAVLARLHYKRYDKDGNEIPVSLDDCIKIVAKTAKPQQIKYKGHHCKYIYKGESVYSLLSSREYALFIWYTQGGMSTDEAFEKVKGIKNESNR